MDNTRHNVCITVNEYKQWAKNQTDPSIYAFLTSLVSQNTLSTSVSYLNLIESTLWLDYKFTDDTTIPNIILIKNDNGGLIPGGRLECLNSRIIPFLLQDTKLL